GRMIAKGRAGEQRLDLFRALQKPTDEGDEPGILLVTAEGREPHLPIEPRLMRLDEGRRAGEVARLPSEFVLEPVLSVVAAFDDDLRACGRHHGEESVAVDEP